MIHVTALESMASQLNDLGVNVSEHDVMTKILCSLPSRFDHLVSSWDSMGDADKTLDALRARLVTEERKINQRIAQGQQPSAGTSQASTSNENNALYGEAGPGPSARTHRNGGGFGRGRRPNTYQTTVSYIHQHKFNYVHHNILFVFQNQIRTKEQIARDSAYCTYCKKSRHYAFECRKRIADEGERQANGA